MTRGRTFGTPPRYGGATRPEKRVLARSSAPQSRCTGLALPKKPLRNSSNTGTIRVSQPEAVRLFRVVGGVVIVVVERDGVCDLNGHGPDVCAQPEAVEPGHQIGVERRHRAGLQWHGSARAGDGRPRCARVDSGLSGILRRRDAASAMW